MIEKIKSVLNVLKLAERLKFELRHSYTSNGKETSEAKVANALDNLDKLEVQLQHNDADISTWEEIEYEMCLHDV